MNEWYIRDTSKKIKTVLKSRGLEGGHHTSNHAIYGYRKDKDNPSKWIIDEEAAQDKNNRWWAWPKWKRRIAT